MSRYKLVNVPNVINLADAVKVFNDTSVNINSLATSNLCDEATREVNACHVPDDCFHCLLAMRYHHTGIGLYPSTKQELFAEYAGQSGYQITRPGFEHFNAKNPVNDVERMKE